MIDYYPTTGGPHEPVQSWPLQPLCDNEFHRLPDAPIPFGGIWLHRTAVKQEVLSGGWKPMLHKQSIYGAAIYLSPIKWAWANDSLWSPQLLIDAGLPPDDPMTYRSDPEVFVCKLVLNEQEVMHEFPSSAKGSGPSHTQLIGYLKEQGVCAPSGPNHAARGQNPRITEHFRSIQKKAIFFTEHGQKVVAVYDPSCIRVLQISSET